MKLAVLSTLITGAAAFTPASLDRVSSSLSATRAVSMKPPAAAVKKAAPVAVKKATPVKSVAVTAAKKAAPIKSVAVKKAVAKAVVPKKGKAIPVKQAAPAKGRSLDNPNPTGLIGALAPIGFFDPAGFAAKASPEELTRYREVEIMHGRFAQLAVLGFLLPEKYAADGTFGDDFLAPSGTALEVFNTDPVWTGLVSVSYCLFCNWFVYQESCIAIELLLIRLLIQLNCILNHATRTNICRHSASSPS
jgi:hypothetical protein